ncbi:MAG: GNAT family N-acetyltransferase [Geminicoccaceae bacterium]
MPVDDALTARICRGVSAIGADAWDRCVPEANPFVSFGYLHAMEESGSAVGDTGWAPIPILLGDEAAPRAITPAYVKSHSYGEYVFDHGWADAYERAGGRYYPKLQVAVPFTPVQGPRLLASDASDRDALIQAIAATANQLELSSAHVTFCNEDEARAFEEAGWLVRHGVQYHWYDQGFGDFDGFLASLRSSRRKTIRRERRDAQAGGVEIEVLTGDLIEPHHVEAFYPFYRATIDKKIWGNLYLNRTFFALLGSALRERIVLVMARQDERYVAGALHIRGEDTLYGRLWGSLADFRFLHFELCYYQGIELALRWGLSRVEAGAQGEHKLQRGYQPSRTYSAHLIRDRGLAEPVRHFVERERHALAREMEAMQELLPFRRDGT